MCCNTFPFDICNRSMLFRRQDGESAPKGSLSSRSFLLKFIEARQRLFQKATDAANLLMKRSEWKL